MQLDSESSAVDHASPLDRVGPGWIGYSCRYKCDSRQDAPGCVTGARLDKVLELLNTYG